ncbi:angiopoietin-2 [Xenopus laevis]|uniref:Fibrinogen C-terminal domain-containing protein n=2 Tax=Xenopus laevis TaxID=8355 RepID=A0A974DHY6_XENLA|nr:angiopoietin-2 [Xenopus laevis]OCT92077.1 hypothetical protein XELAEV_18015134mg [Xenopus laevis]
MERSMILSLVECCILLTVVHIAMASYLKEMENPKKHHHKVQHGPCSYTFLLPEVDNCPSPPADFQVSNSLQRDAPPHAEHQWPTKKLQDLESITENNTQWLQKLESLIQDSVRGETGGGQGSAVQNQTATMLEIGKNILTQTAEQTRKLTDVETQVLNQTSRLEIQLLENSLFTNKLEKDMMMQTQEIVQMREKNSLLEHKVLEIEENHKKEIEGLRSEKLQVDDVLTRQNGLIGELGQQLSEATMNNSMLQRQQMAIMETVGQLINMVSQYNHIPVIPKEDQMTFRDCADVYKSGLTTSGVYTLHYSNTTSTVKVLCEMDISGGGWTVIQHRKDGSVDFHRLWKEYKEGFGSPSGEYWLGNEFVHQLTTHGSYALRIQLRDWDGNEAYSLYDHFSLGNEDHKYRLQVRGYSGTAGRTSSFSPTGTEFSTKDVDNDRCSCRCAQMATGGWWFDACGPSNLNGIYYQGGHSTAKFNGLKWHYWKGPTHGLKSVSMMIRPTDF